MKAARDWLGRRLLPPGRGGYRAIPGPAPKRLPPPPPPTSHTSSMRRKWAEELASKFDRQVQIAQRTPESERSGVREGMIVTWISAAKTTREYGETTPRRAEEVTGYITPDGKVWHPADVTIVRRETNP